jgi:hypothetical protein
VESENDSLSAASEERILLHLFLCVFKLERM